jgi:hypothetical protein
MESQDDKPPFVKRVVLPSGKSIDVTCFPQADGETTAEGLHVCLVCHSRLVFPVEWEAAGPEGWSVLLQCPNCHTRRDGVFDQETVDRFDEELDRGSEALTRDYKSVTRANMIAEIERFAAALEADAILPEDF